MMITNEEMSKLLKRGIEGFVKDGVVDWENIEKLRANMREGTYTEELYNGIMRNLMKLNIFSYNADRNFLLYGCDGHSANPNSSVFFTREQDAKEYKSTRYGTGYSVSVFQLRVVK